MNSRELQLSKSNTTLQVRLEQQVHLEQRLELVLRYQQLVLVERLLEQRFP